MTTSYHLYYWPLALRGHPVRYVLAHLGESWQEAEMEEVRGLKDCPVGDQPIPFMGPPVLHDGADDVWMSQLPAVLLYLGEKHGLVPLSPEARAMTVKILADANDLIDELTLFGGRSMWDRASFDAFIAERFPRWLRLFEEVGNRHGLQADSGTMLGTESLGLADLGLAAILFTMMDKLPPLAPLVETQAPHVAALCRRVAQRPPIAAMCADFEKRCGDIYCGGMIEESIRTMLEDL